MAQTKEEKLLKAKKKRADAKAAKKAAKEGKEKGDLNEAPTETPPVPGVDTVEKTEDTVKTDKVAKKDGVDVVVGSEWIRRYSEEIIGSKDWKKCAEEFAGKDERRKLVPPVEFVAVEWREERKTDAGISLGYFQNSKKFSDVRGAVLFKNEVRGVIKVAR